MAEDFDHALAEAIARQFDARVKKSLANAVKAFFRDMARRRGKQDLFCELPEGQAELFEDVYAASAFGAVESALEIMGVRINVEEPLYSGLLSLDEESRIVIFMAFWLEMNDREISEETGISQRRVQRIRQRAYATLKKGLRER